MVKWSSIVSMRNKETKLKMLYLKEKQRIQGKSSNHESTSEVTCSKPYLNMEYLNILNNMKRVSNEVL